LTALETKELVVPRKREEKKRDSCGSTLCKGGKDKLLIVCRPLS